MTDSSVSLNLKQVDARSYDANAETFDRLTERYSASLAAHIIALAELGATDVVLDVGSGTGLLALRAAAQMPSGRAVGIDHSRIMLDYASAKAGARGLEQRARFEAMDAEALDLPDGEFDAVLSLFVLRHLPNAAAAVSEMYRILKPGGRVVVGIGARPSLLSRAGVQAGIRSVADAILTRVGKRALAPAFLRMLLARHAVAKSHSHAAGHHVDDVATLLRNAGFTDIRCQWRGEEFALDPDAFWDVQAIFDSEARTMLDQLNPAEIARLKDEFTAEAKMIAARGGRLIYRTGALICVGRR